MWTVTISSLCRDIKKGEQLTFDYCQSPVSSQKGNYPFYIFSLRIFFSVYSSRQFVVWKLPRAQNVLTVKSAVDFVCGHFIFKMYFLVSYAHIDRTYMCGTCKQNGSGSDLPLWCRSRFGSESYPHVLYIWESQEMFFDLFTAVTLFYLSRQSHRCHNFQIVWTLYWSFLQINVD